MNNEPNKQKNTTNIEENNSTGNKVKLTQMLELAENHT